MQVQQDLPVILLDADGSTAGAAARDLAAAAEDRPVLYIISGGASAWLAQELPWREPLKLGINLDTIKAIDISGVTEGPPPSPSPPPTQTHWRYSEYSTRRCVVHFSSPHVHVTRIWKC